MLFSATGGTEFLCFSKLSLTSVDRMSGGRSQFLGRSVQVEATLVGDGDRDFVEEGWGGRKTDAMLMAI
jgi:hypothetical protein